MEDRERRARRRRVRRVPTVVLVAAATAVLVGLVFPGRAFASGGPVNGLRGADGLYQVGSGGWSGDSTTSDTRAGWGDDQWQINPTKVTRVSVSVQDCCIVGDNYTVYVDGHPIGTTPPEPYQGSRSSSGTFTALVGPRKHLITIQDVGGIKYYRQGFTIMIPAAYTVTIHLASATITQPTIFVHGIGESATSVGSTEFQPIYAALKALTGKAPDVFPYVDDRAGGQSCQQQPCDSQSDMVSNARQLAKRIHTDYTTTHHKVVLIGYSMGAAIIRTMLAGCPASGDPACQQASGEVGSIFFLAGVQQGSWLMAYYTGVPSDVLNAPLVGFPLSISLQSFMDYAITQVRQIHLNPDDIAEQDLTPESDNILLRNGQNPPSGIHYFNFYGDIHLQVAPTLWGLTPSPSTSQGSLAIGDGVVLPGTDNPTDAPPLGGSKLCLQCSAHNGYESSQLDASTSYTQWALSNNVVVSARDVAACIPLLGKVTGGSCLPELLHAPQLHTNITSASTLDGKSAPHIRDTAGVGSTATITQEIVWQVEMQDGVMP